MKPQILNNKLNKLIKQSKLIKIVLLAASIMMVVMLSGSLYFRDRVYITDNGVTKELMTSETDIDAILAFGNYTIGEHDRVTYKAEDERTAYVTIERAFDVIVKVDGNEMIVPIIEGTVADVIEKSGVKLYEFDLVDLDMHAEAAEGMTITVTRVNYRLRANSSEIPFETIYVDNSNMVIGEEKITTQGENGVRTTVIKEKYIDGVLTENELSSDTIEKEPVTMVIERGTALAEPYAKMENPETLKLVNGLPAEYERVLSGKTTAYTGGYNAFGASGRDCEIGTVAVNPNIIPYGSELYIVSQDGSKVYGYAIASDTGRGLMQGRILADLYFGNKYDYYDDSCRWGSVYCDVYILSEGNG